MWSHTRSVFKVRTVSHGLARIVFGTFASLTIILFIMSAAMILIL